MVLDKTPGTKIGIAKHSGINKLLLAFIVFNTHIFASDVRWLLPSL